MRSQDIVQPSKQELDAIREEALAFSGIGLYRYAFDGTVIFMDEGALRILEIADRFPDPVMVIGKQIGELLIYTGPTGLLRNQVMRERHVRNLEYPFTTLDGKPKWVLHDSYLVKNPRTGEECIQAIIQDITERKAAEEALKASEDKYRHLFDVEPDALFLIDAESARIVDVNAAALALYGYSRDECCQLSATDISDDTEQTLALLRQGSAGETMTIALRYHRRKDGTLFPVEIAGAFFELHGRLMVYTAVRDISERLAAEQALFAEKERLAVTLRSIGDGVIATDRNGRIVLMNSVAETLTAWTQAEAAGRTLEEVFRIVNEKTRRRCEDPVEKVLRTGGVVGLANHTILIAKDGVERVLEDSGAPIFNREGTIIGVVLVFRDSTEKVRMQQELQRADKLDAVGILAGGIAHDFNNLLAVILGNISLVKLHLPSGEMLYTQLDEAERASLRARDLTQQLLTFSKGGAPIKRTTSIRDLIRDAVAFAMHGSKTKSELLLADDLWPADVDEGQFSQLIQNLAINADQAMPDGGVITVTARNVTLVSENPYGVLSGPYVAITLADQGIGISPDHLQRIFDPYFTTKQKGSGLGLTTVYAIVQRHDGAITAESQQGVGTTFTVYLPAAPSAAVATRVAPLTIDRTQQGSILVMDDEDLVRAAVKAMATTLGYQVTTVEDGTAAIAQYAAAHEAGTPFDVVILDLTVPGGMGGAAAVARLLEIDPRVKAIASSGYSNDIIIADYRRFGFCEVMAKPYRINDLHETLHRVLHPAEE